MSSDIDRIVCYNVDNRLANLFRFVNIITEYSPIICLLQDLPGLSKRLITNTFRIIASDYSVIFDKETLRRHKKLDNLLLVDKERIKVEAVYLNERRSKATSLGVLISCIVDDESSNSEIIERGRLLLFSVYIRPRSSPSETRDCLEWMNDISRETVGYSRTMILGDMNASNPLWCPIDQLFENKESSSSHYRQVKLLRGRQIATYMDKMNMTCLNQVSQGPTFVSKVSRAYIDLAFVGNKTIRRWNMMNLTSLWDNSNHKVLILLAKATQPTEYGVRTYKRIKLDLIKADHFFGLHLLCDSMCINWRQLPRDRIISRLEAISKRLYSTLQAVQEKITVTRIRRRRRRIRNTNQRFTSIINSRIRSQVTKLHRYQAKRARLGRRMANLTHSNRNFHGVREMFNTASHSRNYSDGNSLNERYVSSLRMKIRRLRRNISNSIKSDRLHLMNENTGDSGLWSRFNMMDREDTFRRQESELTTADDGPMDQDDINRLASEKFPFRVRLNNDFVKLAELRTRGSTRIEITEHEVTSAIRDLRNKRYRSSSGLRMDVFYQSIQFIYNIIKTLCEMSFWACHVPSNAKITTGTLIPKKIRGQFRIVHVSSPLSALLELIALKRLEYRLEVSRLNSPYQFGFVKLVSRHDLISRMIEFFFKEFIHVGRNSRGLIINLDIEGAFDNVNQDILISKLDKELSNDRIRYWLAEFILNRKISIKKGNLRSSLKNICMGVPQGSALGPILWNYVIHDIDEDIVRSGEIELLRYADDIFLIYNGSDKVFVQSALDKLVNKLRLLDLRVRPEKCSVMGIKLGKHDWRLNIYRIDGQPIKRVRNMNILGVPLTWKLKLNRKSEEHYKKLLENVRRLNNANKLGLVNSAKESRMLIDSFINSLLIQNNWPVLIFDQYARKWIDNLLIRSISMIFEWPANVSIKLIRLITGNIECLESVRNIAKQRQLVAYPRIYDFLLKDNLNNVMNESRTSYSGTIEERRLQYPKLNLETEVVMRRRHYDPSKWPTISEYDRFDEGMTEADYTWIILDRGLGSMMAEMNNRQEVSQVRIGKHIEYSISYFNSFALLLKIASDRTISHRCLTISNANSMLMALENSHNRDWRVIQLRERLYDNGWRLRRISLAEERRIRTRLVTEYMRRNLRYDNNAVISDFRLWLLANEGLLNNSDYTGRIRVQHQVESLTEPYLLDYKRRNHLNKRISTETNRYFLQSHTTVTRALSSQIDIWQSVTANWLDGIKMLVLSGMLNNENGSLQHTSNFIPWNCQYCEDNSIDDDNSEIPSDWHGLDDNSIDRCIILHKTFKCKKYIEERRMFLRHINSLLAAGNNVGGQSTIERILSNRIHCQRLFRLMVQCCMNA